MAEPTLFAERGSLVYNRDGSEAGTATGGERKCQLDGCPSQRVGVRWPNGKMTWPCIRGLLQRADGAWQIR